MEEIKFIRMPDRLPRKIKKRLKKKIFDSIEKYGVAHPDIFLLKSIHKK